MRLSLGEALSSVSQMAEQLELFDESDFSQENEGNPNDIEPLKEETKQGQVSHLTGHDQELTLRAAKLLRGLDLSNSAEAVSVIWNKRMRSAAGRARYRECQIELNPRLQSLPESKSAEEIENTFLHELAHLVAFGRNRNRRIQPHGPEWKRACADLGIPGENRCHDLELETRRMERKFIYECPVCGSSIPRVRRIKRPVACHPCCKANNRGKFDSRFQLVEKRLT